MSEQITGALQENLLTLLIFNDTAAPIILNSVEPGLFESDFYKEIVKVALTYFKEYKKPPKEHIADLLEHKINDTRNPKSGELYEKILKNLFHSKENINVEFVLNKLNRFIRRQSFKAAIVEAALLIKDETDESLDIAENTVNKVLKNKISAFDRGTSFKETNRLLAALRTAATPCYPFGVPHLDNMNIGPAKGELLIFLAPPNRGKSWSLINMGKHCLRQRLKVLHITLEMPESNVLQRYIQSIYSLRKDHKEVNIARFQKDDLERLNSFGLELLERPSLKDDETMAALAKRLDKDKFRYKLEMKYFPTGSLTVEGLEVFLDTLDRLYHYVPDVLLLDYADLMKLDYKNLRTSTGEIYKELRRIAGERDLAMVTASQANRASEDARIITLKHLAEDYSKAATADTVVAFCQTQPEKSLNLARLFVAKARNEENGQSVLISQGYGIGQFCMDSTTITDRYWNLVDQANEMTVDGDGNSSDNQPRTPRPTFRRRGS